MTKPDDVLLEVVVHSEDIRKPLGLHRDFPAGTLVGAADRLKGYGFPFGVKKKIAGLRLQATDTEWSVGDGQVATGSLEALVMAMAGRRVALDDLSGPGVGTLAERLPTV